MGNLLFYVVSLGAVLSAVGVILARNPVMSVLSLLGSFFCVSVIYLLAGFQFMAAVQILVYAGAIMVLFLFVVMLLNLGDPDVKEPDEPAFLQGRRAVPALLIAAAMFLAGLYAVLASEPLPPVDPGLIEEGNDPALGLATAMFGRYALPFEAASVLLLATAVGVLVLAKRQRPGTGGGAA